MTKSNYFKGKDIFKTLSGSRLYGFYNEDSDYDYRGVFLADIENYIGLQNIEEKIEDGENNKSFEFKKFIKLSLECNPNIIELLYVKTPILCTEEFQILRDNRHLFLSKKAKFTFSGYAYAQLKRMKNHKLMFDKYEDKLINFPQEPKREDYNLSTKPLFSSTLYNSLIMSPIDEIKLLTHNNYLFDVIQNEKRWKSDHNEWRKLKEWFEGRNDKRFKLEYKYGFDCKHACHLVRLLRMGIEILEKGEVIVERPDAKELKDIRNGKWTYKQIIQYAEDCDKELEVLYKTSSLQHKPQFEKVNKICQDILGIYVKENLHRVYPS